MDMKNYKPYRTTAQKVVARATAQKVNGTWVSNAPVSRHAIKPTEKPKMVYQNKDGSQ